jgi:hypothetical protein
MITSKNTKINQCLAEIVRMDFQVVRTDKKDYFEAVISKSKLGDLIAHLEKAFGVARYPSDKELSGHAREVTDRFGGIMGGQSLYFSENPEDKEDSIFVMLWPWQDGVNITLKIFQD